MLKRLRNEKTQKHVFRLLPLYIYMNIKLFKEKTETFHFVIYFDIAFINYIFIQQNKMLTKFTITFFLTAQKLKIVCKKITTFFKRRVSIIL